tara:strand:+ start:5744 stop:6067 length:324 start_codon:yes stop_codon:yes gene_type:complete
MTRLARVGADIESVDVIPFGARARRIRADDRERRTRASRETTEWTTKVVCIARARVAAKDIVIGRGLKRGSTRGTTWRRRGGGGTGTSTTERVRGRARAMYAFVDDG